MLDSTGETCKASPLASKDAKSLMEVPSSGESGRSIFAPPGKWKPLDDSVSSYFATTLAVYSTGAPPPTPPTAQLTMVSRKMRTAWQTRLRLADPSTRSESPPDAGCRDGKGLAVVPVVVCPDGGCG